MQLYPVGGFMKKLLMLGAASLMVPAYQAQAAEMIGDTVSCQQTGAGSSFTCDMSQATIGAGREFTVGNSSPFIGLNFGGNGLRIRNISGGPFSLNFTIIRLENLSQIFQSVSIANENIVGFDASDITLTNGVLTLDFRGTTWSTNDLANLSLNATSAVPEPSTWMMLILGLGAVGASMRLQRRRKSDNAYKGAWGLRHQSA